VQRTASVTSPDGTSWWIRTVPGAGQAAVCMEAAEQSQEAINPRHALPDAQGTDLAGPQLTPT